MFIDSEAQSGKSYCDAKIAHMRGKFSKVVASGYNILTAANMKSAIDLYEGTAGCQAAHVKLQGFPPSTAKCPIKGITKISNVKFEPKHLTTWRAFNIGIGKQLPIEHENNVSVCAALSKQIVLLQYTEMFIMTSSFRSQTSSTTLTVLINAIQTLRKSFKYMTNHCMF